MGLYLGGLIIEMIFTSEMWALIFGRAYYYYYYVYIYIFFWGGEGAIIGILR